MQLGEQAAFFRVHAQLWKQHSAINPSRKQEEAQRRQLDASEEACRPGEEGQDGTLLRKDRHARCLRDLLRPVLGLRAQLLLWRRLGKKNPQTDFSWLLLDQLVKEMVDLSTLLWALGTINVLSIYLSIMGWKRSVVAACNIWLLKTINCIEVQKLPFGQ